MKRWSFIPKIFLLSALILMVRLIQQIVRIKRKRETMIAGESLIGRIIQLGWEITGPEQLLFPFLNTGAGDTFSNFIFVVALTPLDMIDVLLHEKLLFIHRQKKNR